MKNILAALISLISFSVSAQKITKYYDYRWKECAVGDARYYSVIEWKDSLWQRDDIFIIERKLQMRGTFTDSATKVAHGKFYYFYPNGKVEKMGRYVYGKKEGIWRAYYSNGMMEDSTVYSNGHPQGVSMSFHKNGYVSDSSVYNTDGTGVYVSWFDDGRPASAGKYVAGNKKNGKWKYYHRNGAISCEEIFESGQLMSRTYFNEAGNVVGDSTNTNKPAQFPGGDKAWSKYIRKQIYFPDGYTIINTNRIAVVVNAVVNEKGEVTEAEVSVPFHEAFNKIALDAVKRSPKWEPAVQYGRNVKYRISQTVIFEDLD